MIIKHMIDFVEGDIDTDKQELSCGASRKYGHVALSFDCGMHVGFATIKLHSHDSARDAEMVFDDAKRLGDEIARRWNKYKELELELIRLRDVVSNEDAEIINKCLNDGRND